MVGGDPYCCELLLHDHAQVGCVDENGWQEIHQVKRLAFPETDKFIVPFSQSEGLVFAP